MATKRTIALNSKNPICIRFTKVCETLVTNETVSSFSKLAQSLEIHSQHFYSLLDFKSKPTLVQLEALHKKYHVNMNYIFNKSDQMFLQQAKK